MATDPYSEFSDIVSDPNQSFPIPAAPAADDPYAAFSDVVSDPQSGAQAPGAFAPVDPTRPLLSKEALGRGIQKVITDNANLKSEEIEGLVQAYVDQNAPGNSVDSKATIAAFKRGSRVTDQVDYTNPYENEDGAFGAGLRGVGDVLTSGYLDEAGALVDTLGGTAGRPSIWQEGDESFGSIYTRNRDENRRILSSDEQYQAAARMAGQFIGGAVLPTSGLRAGVGRLAAEGAAYGAAYGAGSSNGTIAQRALGAAGGGALGGVLGGAMAGAGRGAANWVARRAGPRGRAVEAGAVMDATDDIERLTRRIDPTTGQPIDGSGARITPLAADIGGTGVRVATAGVGQSLVGASPIRNAAQRVLSEAETARGRLASQLDPNALATTRDGAAETLRDGLNTYRRNSSTRASRMYTAAETAAAGELIGTPRTISMLNSEIARMEQVPGGATGIETLRELRDNLAPGGFTVAGLRDLRTSVGDRMGVQGLRGSTASRRLDNLWGTLSEDITQGLTDAGNGRAAQLYRTADRNYAQRIDDIDNVLTPILGAKTDAPKSAEQIITALGSMQKGDGVKLGRALALVDTNTAATVRGNVVMQLGQAGLGEQRAFSLPTFATQWGNGTFSPAAKTALFGAVGTPTRDGLEALATVARSVQTSSRFANHSNTAGAVGVQSALAAIGAGGVSLPGAVGVLAANYGAGVLLGSRWFARELAQIIRNGGPTAQTFRRLSTLATKEPAMAQEITGFRDVLEQQRLEASNPIRDIKQPE